MMGLFAFSQLAQSQEKNKRITISSGSQMTINSLLEEGIDLRCGSIMTSNSIQLELSAQELNRLDAKGIQYTVQIDDMTKFYSQRTTDNIEHARTDLEIEKLRTGFSSAQSNRTSVSSVTLDNFLQYEGCDEVDWATPVNFNLNPNPPPNSFGGCLTVSQVEAELDQMRALYPNLISVKANASPSGELTRGNTYGNASQRFSGQTVYYVRISDNPDTDEANEPEVLYTSMIHSREVSSLMGLLYYMWYVLENYDTNPAIKNLVDSNEMYFIPVVNPDGLRWNEVIAPNGGGFQRKNLRINPGESQSTNPSNSNRGVDLNRNFDYLFGSAGDPNGSSGNPVSGTYRGPSAFSEPESRILRDFVLSKNFETALMHHSFSNAMPHPYGGIPTKLSGREDEMHKWHEDMTEFNRYIAGATVFTAANGVADDWMLGGTPDANGSVGSGRNILASTPENGHGSESGSSGFWPNPVNIVPIAKRMMRINLISAYYAGQYARLHDLTPSNVTTLTSNLTHGIERLGQTPSDFTMAVTPVSANIVSASLLVTQTGMSILEQRNISTQIQLDPGIQPNDIIEYKIQLTNGNGIVFYDANYSKIYQPNVLFQDNPDTDGLSNWTASGNWTTSSANPFSGTTSIKAGSTVPYANNINSTLTSASSYNLAGTSKVLIQFYSRWDLERNFDFVEIEGSTNGISWQPLCGKYNKPKASTTSNDSHRSKASSSHSFQNNNSSGLVYDGDQMNKWIQEEIVIDGNTNSFLFNAPNASFRFRFRTDSNNRPENFSTDYSGFFMDDFKIIKIELPCVITVPTNVTTTSITTNGAKVDWDLIPSATYDLRYRTVGTTPWTNVPSLNSNTYTITGLTASSNYEVQVRTTCATGSSNYTLSTNFTTQDIVACTGSTINGFPYTENFNAGIGSWTQATADDGNWTLNSNGTPSTVTGPNDDFNGGGNYFYTEASTNGLGFNATVNLISPCFDLTGYKNASFSFYYHMYGISMGNLNTDISLDNGNNWTTLNTISGQQQTSNEAAWLQRTINLSAYDGLSIKLRFSGTTGPNWESDIAIDQINLSATLAPTGPVASCQNITVELDENGMATIAAVNLDNGTSVGTLSITMTNFDCSNIGNPVAVTLSAELDGTTDTCVATVTVSDAINPIPDVSPLPDVTVNNQLDLLTSPTATDNCDGSISGTNTIVFPITESTTVVWTYTDNSGNSITQNQSVIILDTIDPVAPTNLVAANTTQSTTDLSWTATTDNIEVLNYDVIQDGVTIATVLFPNYQVTNLTANTSYVFTVTARDAAGNTSTPSNTVNVTTLEVSDGCIGGVTNYPYNESFESGLGAWTQSNNGDDDIDWTINSNGTPSNNTGPSSAVNGNFYAYVEASGDGLGFPNKRAILNSPCFDLTNAAIAAFNFKYHMFGSDDFGTINLEVSDDNGATWTSIWNTFANQGNRWITANIDLSTYIGGRIQLRFNRVTGGTWQADFALDDVNLLDELPAGCLEGITNFPYNESFESNFGLWTQSNSDDIDWTRNSNGTPSSGTGPSNAANGNFYIYVEASGNGVGFPNRQAILTSPCFDLTNESAASFNFDYHMFGSEDFGTINLEVSNDNGISWASIWGLAGNQGNNWLSQSINLSAYLGSRIQLRFNRIIGGTWQADFAFDTISLSTSGGAKIAAKANPNPLSNSITLYPNPVNNGILNVDTVNNDLNYAIYTIYGQRIHKGILKDKSINVSHLEAAVYMIEFYNSKNKIVKRFIKN